MTRSVCLLVLAAALGTSAPPQGGTLPAGAERAYGAVTGRFDRDAAFAIVTYMDRFWRVAGNPGFDASVDHIRERLVAAGFSTSAGTAPFVRIDEYANAARGWDYRVGTVTLDGEPDGVVLSRERDRVSLAINSFSTPAGGLRVPIVDVGNGGSEKDFEGRDVKGAVVLGDASLGRLWQQAVRTRGAAGVISTEIASYIRPSDPGKMTEEEQDVFQWGSIPYDAASKSFGFKAPWRAAARIRERLTRGPAHVRVQIESSFYDGPVRSLVAEIPGRSRAADRIVMVAHIQEPGANDDASGCATLYGVARAIAEAIRAGALPQPERTLTFLWVDEIRGSRQWLQTHAEEARGLQYMFSLDMTGEDTQKTGGTFLIEKQADPSAVWPRPSDPHTEWGAGQVKAETLRGSLLNDLHIAVAERRAKDTGWVVRTNPYEGGSDHTVFADAGVPSLLNWHFTDRYYHTNQDRPDKTSAAEMEHVGITVATSAWFLASATRDDAAQVVDLIAGAAARRLALERKQGADLVARATDRDAAARTEQQVMAAWQKWYREAFDSVLALPADGPDDRLRSRVAAARALMR
jgi:hypothetical protein